jgi:hypothetical protein
MSQNGRELPATLHQDNVRYRVGQENKKTFAHPTVCELLLSGLTPNMTPPRPKTASFLVFSSFMVGAGG